MRFVIKPVFVNWVVLTCYFPAILFLGSLTTFLITPFVNELFLGISDENNYSYALATWIGLGGATLFSVISYISTNINYKKTVYQFYDDRIEFEEGFLVVQKKVIRFKDIKEIDLRKGVLQRMVGLGSIYLATQATGLSGQTQKSLFSAFGASSVTASGLILRDITDPDATYEKVKSLVQSGSGQL